MGEHLMVWRVRVPQSSVEQLLEVEPLGVAEGRRLCPDLLAAELVDLGDGTWLHVLRWSRPDGPDRLMGHADRFDARRQDARADGGRRARRAWRDRLEHQVSRLGPRSDVREPALARDQGAG